MPATAELKDRETALATLVNQAKTLRADIEARDAKGETVPDDDRQKLRNMIDDGTKKRQQLEELKALLNLDEYVAAPGGNSQRALEIAMQGGSYRRSWGEAVVASDQFKNNDKRELLPVEVGNFIKLFGGPSQTRALYGSGDTAGGFATINDRQPDVLDIARQRPQSILDLVNKSTTNSDAVEYVLMDTRDNQAAYVTDYSAGQFGLKPESNVTLDLKTATVGTLATWVAASRQILNDAPRLRDMIDGELRYMVRVKLEDKLITDILAWANIQSRVHAVSGRNFSASDKVQDTIRRAITDLYLEFYAPDGVVINPVQGEAMELDKDTTGQYTKVYDSATLRVWRVPVLETAAITAGTGLVANFKMGVTLWDREQTQVLTGQPNDFFLRNAFAILAELREAHAVTRPKAIEKITGM